MQPSSPLQSPEQSRHSVLRLAPSPPGSPPLPFLLSPPLLFSFPFPCFFSLLFSPSPVLFPSYFPPFYFVGMTEVTELKSQKVTWQNEGKGLTRISNHHLTPILQAITSSKSTKPILTAKAVHHEPSHQNPTPPKKPSHHHQTGRRTPTHPKKLEPQHKQPQQNPLLCPSENHTRSRTCHARGPSPTV
ncbi:hypothetical protein CKAN_02103500 [Cinnamomum micranthum f. kanehirae]|uniref:Uncharacterized protein n=1 Tax=Cinnamomum micranthum f. kanehirae TaxID=337451 RepID=A0A443PM67_9MAGN|nr:hypothetical protein CKAN_02103500 [Cinnamomum micranthum f. kanehirae]